jgi:hypothetical protein
MKRMVSVVIVLAALVGIIFVLKGRQTESVQETVATEAVSPAPTNTEVDDATKFFDAWTRAAQGAFAGPASEVVLENVRENSGFPIRASSKETPATSKIEDTWVAVIGDGLSGGVILEAYVKSLVDLPPHLGLDTVIELSLDRKKKIREWKVPFEATPLAIEDDQIIVKADIRVGLETKTVGLAIRPDGSFNVVKADNFQLRPKKCPEATNSTDFTVCSEIKDKITESARQIAWQVPMT